MRYVRRRTADLLEGILEARGHAVEASDEVIQFVARAPQWNLQRKVRAGDFLRRQRHLIHGLNRAACQRPAK